jgi:hypothetical protein
MTMTRGSGDGEVDGRDERWLELKLETNARQRQTEERSRRLEAEHVPLRV